MKRFIIKTSCFITFCLIIYLVGVLCTRHILRNKSFAIPTHKNIVVLGNSWTECAIDDTILDNYFNYSQSSDHYLHSYLKLKFLLRDNPQIDTLLLGFSTFMTENDALIANKIQLHYPLMDFSDYKTLAERKFSILFNFPIFKHLGEESYMNLLGGFLPLERDKLQKNIEIFEKSENMKISKLDTLYLHKIETICKEKNVKLILITPPLYHIEKYHDTKRFDLLRTYCKDITLLDYRTLPLADSCYGDLEHLNKRGAREFSTYLKSKQNGN